MLGLGMLLLPFPKLTIPHVLFSASSSIHNKLGQQDQFAAMMFITVRLLSS